MANRLSVLAYNVLFGDAILIEVPDGKKKQYILIDVGSKTTGDDKKGLHLLEALKNIHQQTGGKIDLYIMTHEHLDHVKGLLYGDKEGIKFRINTVWMPLSSEPGYYDRHPKAKQKRLELLNAVSSFIMLIGESNLPEDLKAMLDICSGNTNDCVNYIRKSTPNVHYLCRGSDTKGKHPIKNVSFRILAPEEDTGDYFRSIPRFSLSVDEKQPGSKKGLPLPLPLPGVDAGAFYDLIDRMDNGFSESVYAIDRAENDSGLVFELTWRGKRLLLTGDAEEKSWGKIWEEIGEKSQLKYVDMFKFAHHCSSNGLPTLEILDKILPQKNRTQAVAILSTSPAVGSDEPCIVPKVPDEKTHDVIRSRTKKIYSTTEVDIGKPVIVTLEAM
jgi:hypothetical protein